MRDNDEGEPDFSTQSLITNHAVAGHMHILGCSGMLPTRPLVGLIAGRHSRYHARSRLEGRRHESVEQPEQSGAVCSCCMCATYTASLLADHIQTHATYRHRHLDVENEHAHCGCKATYARSCPPVPGKIAQVRSHSTLYLVSETETAYRGHSRGIRILSVYLFLFLFYFFLFVIRLMSLQKATWVILLKYTPTVVEYKSFGMHCTSGELITHSTGP